MDVSLFGVPLLGQLSRETKRESKKNGGSPQKRHKLKGKVLKSDVNQSLVLSETSAAGSTTTGRGGREDQIWPTAPQILCAGFSVTFGEHMHASPMLMCWNPPLPSFFASLLELSLPFCYTEVGLISDFFAKDMSWHFKAPHPVSPEP